MSLVLYMAIGIIVTAVVTYIAAEAMKRPVKHVMLLRPRDSRGRTLKVVEETDMGLVCKKSGGIVHRFIKIGRGWTFNDRGRMITRFLGLEGTAYTPQVIGDETENVSLAKFLRFLWDDDFYDSIPSEQKQAVETDVIGITLKVEKIEEETRGLPILTGDDIHDEEDSVMMKRFAKDVEGTKQGGSILMYGLMLLMGGMIMYFLITRGIV